MNESVALELTLQDFVCSKLVCSFENIENPRLSIPSKALCRHYDLAKTNHLKEVARTEEKKRQEEEAEQAPTQQDQV